MNRCKVQFYLSPDAKEELLALVEESRGSTISEVVRKALSVYREAVRITRAGGRMQFVDVTGRVERVVIPGFGSKG